MSARDRCLRLLALIALGVGLHASSALAGDGYDARLGEYRAQARSNSLAVRTLAAEALASTRDPRAITVLANAYARPRNPMAQSRHALVGTLARHFDDERFVEPLAGLRAKHATPEDAWLWYRTLVIHGRHAGMDAVWAAARDTELPPRLRAAAVGAAATLGDPGVAQLAAELLPQLPAEAAGRAVLVQSLATALVAVRENIREDALARAADALIAHLATNDVAEATRVVAGRALQQLLDSRFAYLDGAAWQNHRVRPGATRKSDARRLRPARCAGVGEDGLCVAYVLDVSDGAAEPTTETERERLTGGVVGPGSRLALMQHAVRESIRDLKPPQSFLVLVAAHHRVEPLPGFTRPVPATYDNQLAAFRALEQVQPGGEADLHAGLMRAYQAHAEGFVDEQEHLAAETVLGGCDTLFVFSHASSRVDQWVAENPARREERRRTLTCGLGVTGLYADPEWLGEELQRWRLFRKAHLHLISFGDAYADIVRRLARCADAYRPHVRYARDQHPPLPPATEKYESTKEAYVAYLSRPSLAKRTLGRWKLAHTGHLRALEDLARSYARVEPPVPVLQQIVVDICHEAFHEKRALPSFERWRGRHAQREDAWLWHRALQVAASLQDVATPLRAGAEAHDPFLRAAALRAAAKQGCREMLARIPGWMKRIRGKKAEGLDRVLPIEAMATALLEMRWQKDEETYKQAALALLGAFDDPATPARTRLTIVRNIAAALEVPPESLDKNVWIREVRAGGSSMGIAGHRYGAPTFGGLRASGKRVCYVIDMSDSMLTPLAPDERMQPKVVTGNPKTGGKRRPEDEINWATVKSRFDLARAMLIMSLQTLPPGTDYCVIWFGNEAGMLKTTPGLVTATPKSVAKTVSELRAIKPGPVGGAGTQVKYGSLRGETNLHGGLVRAFTRTADKPLTGFAYVSEEALTAGCDTIFLLSDGAPTTDDFVREDKRDPEDHAVKDRETAERTEDTPTLLYPGPYCETGRSQMLFWDVERRNLFRQVEIHCLGMGDANMGVLRRLAELGLGQCRKIGEDRDEK